MVDIEADGPIPGDYSMIALGAVVVEPTLAKGFFGTLKPISEKWVPDALAVAGYTSEETMKFDDPLQTMQRFNKWVRQNSQGRPLFVSDNNRFDWMFTRWYFIHFLEKDPFGHSSTNLGSLYKGCVCDMTKNFKHLRKSRHTHNPLEDAVGNARVMLEISKRYAIDLDWRW